MTINGNNDFQWNPELDDGLVRDDSLDKDEKVAPIPLKLSKFHDLEVHLANWVKRMRRDGRKVSGEMMQDKGRDLAKDLNLTEFNPSMRWLYDFKKRFKLRRIEKGSNDGPFDIRSALEVIAKELDNHEVELDPLSVHSSQSFDSLQKAALFLQKAGFQDANILYGCNMVSLDEL